MKLQGDYSRTSEFKHELGIIENLRCPFIIGYVGAVVIPGKFCLVTEFAPLGSLAAVYKRSNLSYDFKCRALFDCSRGMAYLHQSRIMHRAPEILDAEHGAKYSFAADVYSFAILGYELFTEQEPYSNTGLKRAWDICEYVVRMNRLPIPNGWFVEISADLAQMLQGKCDVGDFVQPDGDRKQTANTVPIGEGIADLTEQNAIVAVPVLQPSQNPTLV
eukprot:m51a1_g12544 putative tyrosine (218) ;mRNA; f:739-1899